MLLPLFIAISDIVWCMEFTLLFGVYQALLPANLCACLFIFFRALIPAVKIFTFLNPAIPIFGHPPSQVRVLPG